MNNSAMFSISYGLYVAAVSDKTKRNGCIINSVGQVANNPTRLAICINKANFTCEMLQKTGEIVLSVLSEKATLDIFKQFGFRSGKDVEDKFDGASLPTVDGIPYLPDVSCAYLVCKVLEQKDLGSHIMFISEVVDGDVLSSDAPMTYAYYQANVKNSDSKPKEKKKGYICKVCGYIYEGDELPPDFICPICKHRVEDFEKLC